MTFDRAFDIPSHVVARNVGEETVILDLAVGTYYGLDPVGARIWELIEGGETLLDIRDAIIEEYDVTRETVERDILALTQELSEKKLISHRAKVDIASK